MRSIQNYSHLMELDEFRQRFYELRDMGFVKSLRKGDTGVGHTLEVLLGLEENNIALPDLDIAELKAHRRGASSPITLFTSDKNVWKVKQAKIIDDFGLVDESGRTSLYLTLKCGDSHSKFDMSVGDSHVWIQDKSGSLVAMWELDSLVEKFVRKFPALIFVTAEHEFRVGDDWFHYSRAQLLEETSEEKFRIGLSQGWITIDLRMHLKAGRVRNHGTAFRILENKIVQLFEEICEI